MSMAPLSINAEREDAIDFTKPFKSRAITVLMRTPEQQTWYFQFMAPLSNEVWFATLGAFVIISFLLFLLERYSRRFGGGSLIRLDFSESYWFIFGALVSGSSESTPATLPGRVLTSAWWFFSLILISTYTANLAAFLTVKRINPPISDMGDLASQTKIQYGTVRNSGVEMFFRNTKIEPFSNMWASMSELMPDSMVNNTAEGLKKVKEGDYAFLWDSTVTSYVAATDCEFIEIGPSVDPKGFGIGVPPGATYREDLSMAILKLIDSGYILELEHK